MTGNIGGDEGSVQDGICLGVEVSSLRFMSEFCASSLRTVSCNVLFSFSKASALFSRSVRYFFFFSRDVCAARRFCIRRRSHLSSILFSLEQAFRFLRRKLAAGAGCSVTMIAPSRRGEETTVSVECIEFSLSECTDEHERYLSNTLSMKAAPVLSRRDALTILSKCSW